MEGLASNFEAVLSHFEEHLQGAMYAAVDMEFTGTHIDNMPDSYEDSAAERMSKLCQVAETHTPIQIGITLVKHQDNCFQCSSYTFYAFPWVGPELLGQDPSFQCRASAMQFNADKDHIDFNKWLKQAVPYMSREDEANYLASPLSQGDTDLPRKTGLLRIWKLLCEARLPLVTHCPLDIFFLLSCFERRKLPRDPEQMAKLILQCIPCVFDTAHLHGSIGGFQSLRLVKFLEDAQAKHAQLAVSKKALPCNFCLVPETAVKYGCGADLAHEAGYDSLCTAQLYAYLLNLSPEIVEQSVNRLFLFKSMECLDLRQAADSGAPGSSIFDLTRESLVVAKLCPRTDAHTLKIISGAGYVYKKIGVSHVLVIIKDSGSGAVSKGAALGKLVPGVEWLSLDQWRIDVRSHAEPRPLEVRAKCNNLRNSASNSTIGSNSTACVAPSRSSSAKSWLDGDVDKKQQLWLDGGVEPLYNGVVKAFNFNAADGYGFITCAETWAIFKRDVFIHSSQIKTHRIGDQVSFTVSTNARGQPQANDLRALGARAWLGNEVDPLAMDADEAGTTIGASSDCASASDLDSIGCASPDMLKCADLEAHLGSVLTLQ